MSDPRSLLRAAKAELARAEGLAEQWRAAVTALEKVVEKQPELAPTALSGSDGPPSKLSEMSGPGAAAAVLKDAGGPLRLREIVRRVQAGGYRPEMSPAKLSTSLYTSFYRQKTRFKKAGKGRWTLINSESAA